MSLLSDLVLYLNDVLSFILCKLNEICTHNLKKNIHNSGEISIFFLKTTLIKLSLNLNQILNDKKILMQHSKYDLYKVRTKFILILLKKLLASCYDNKPFVKLNHIINIIINIRNIYKTLSIRETNVLKRINQINKFLMKQIMFFKRILLNVNILNVDSININNNNDYSESDSTQYPSKLYILTHDIELSRKHCLANSQYKLSGFHSRKTSNSSILNKKSSLRRNSSFKAFCLKKEKNNYTPSKLKLNEKPHVLKSGIISKKHSNNEFQSLKNKKLNGIGKTCRNGKIFSSQLYIYNDNRIPALKSHSLYRFEPTSNEESVWLLPNHLSLSSTNDSKLSFFSQQKNKKRRRFSKKHNGKPKRFPQFLRLYKKEMSVVNSKYDELTSNATMISFLVLVFVGILIYYLNNKHSVYLTYYYSKK